MVLSETRGLWLCSIVREGIGWLRRLACWKHGPDFTDYYFPPKSSVARSTSVRPPSVPVLVAKGMSNGARDLFGNSCTATPVLRRWLDRPIRRSEVRA